MGLYAARDIEKHTMVIEYIGEIIRTELAECREKQYEAKVVEIYGGEYWKTLFFFYKFQNRGIYMFRLDENRVVDATLSGGLARYINHSCNPNCVAETVEVERDVRIIIFSKRRIQRGEEVSKFKLYQHDLFLLKLIIELNALRIYFFLKTNFSLNC